MNNDTSELGIKLKALVKKKGFVWREVELMLGISHSSLHRYVKNGTLHMDDLYNIFEIIGTTNEEIIEFFRD